MPDLGSSDFLNLQPIIGNLGSINGGVAKGWDIDLMGGWLNGLMKDWEVGLGSTFS